MKNKDFFVDAKAQVVIYEGLHIYGGMSGRDMAALAQGIRESVGNDDYIDTVSSRQTTWASC
jgi:tyrosine phenol-lyase